MAVILRFIISTALFVPAYFFSMRFNLHMFQLNGYKNKEHFNWYKKNVRQQWILIFAFALGVTGILMSLSVYFYAKRTVGNALNGILTVKDFRTLGFYTFIHGIIELLSYITLLLIIFVYKALKNLNKKKKLVYTARIKRLVTTNIIVGALVLLILCKLTGSGTLANLHGIYLIVTSLQLFMCIIANIINHPVEKAVNNYYINDAKRMLKNVTPGINVIGVTGSYGKTSVKFYLQTLLKEKYNVLVTPESYNTPMGVVKTIRGSLKPSHEIFVCEMGARHVGDIKEICDIVHPDNGVITSVGPQHLETFFTMENIRNTKFELADALPDGGMLFLNGDNEYIQEKAAQYKNKCFYYANQPAGNATDAVATITNATAKKNSTATVNDIPHGYYAKDIKVSQFGTSFSVVAPDGTSESFNMRLVGAHNVINVTGAIAVANTLGIDLKDLVIPVRRIEPVEHRMQLREHGNVTIIDDAYNSNPVGSKAAVETLAMFEGLRILVTPGMVELGDKEEEYNYKFGTYAAKCCDYIVLVGEKHTKPIYEGIKSEGFPENKCKIFEHVEDALNYAYGLKEEGHKYILLENDLPDNY